MRSKVTSRKFKVFLFASIVILRPLNSKTFLTSCSFSISFGVALLSARLLLRLRPTSSLNFGAD